MAWPVPAMVAAIQATAVAGIILAGDTAIPLAVASPLMQLFLWDTRRRFAPFPHAQAAAG